MTIQQAAILYSVSERACSAITRELRSWATHCTEYERPEPEVGFDGYGPCYLYPAITERCEGCTKRLHLMRARKAAKQDRARSKRTLLKTVSRWNPESEAL